METQRLRRRRSRKRARKKQITWLVVLALVIGIGVWGRILVERRNDASLVDAVLARSDPEATVAPGASSAARPRVPAAAPPASAARNLVLFVGHGFGMVPMTATRLYSGGEDGELAIDRLPETAMVRTGSRNAQTADSAAAMSAYLTGVRVDNEVLSQTADTHPYDESGRAQSAHGETSCPSIGNGKRAATLLEMAKASGRAVGIVTTGRVTQAGISAAYAHLCQRDGENTIATQLVPDGPGTNARLGDGVDVILGGGWARFLPKDDPRGSSRNDGRDLFAEMRAKGYAVIGRQGELAAAAQAAQGTTQPVDKLLGLFARGTMSFEADRLGTSEPSLAEMTGRAIDLLAQKRTGFLLIVEGHNIGEALDGSLARKALQEGRGFDDAVKVAIDKLRATDPELRDTLVVATADHDHTLVMNGNASFVERTTETRPGVLGLLRPYDAPAQLAQDASGRPYTTLVFGTGEKRVRGPRSQAPALTDLALGARDSRYESAIEVTAGPGGTIGGADVLLGAIGANAARFHGTLDNTQVFALLREALGL